MDRMAPTVDPLTASVSKHFDQWHQPLEKPVAKTTDTQQLEAEVARVE
jgi:hypothetical protein